MHVRVIYFYDEIKNGNGCIRADASAILWQNLLPYTGRTVCHTVAGMSATIWQRPEDLSAHDTTARHD